MDIIKGSKLNNNEKKSLLDAWNQRESFYSHKIKELEKEITKLRKSNNQVQKHNNNNNNNKNVNNNVGTIVKKEEGIIENIPLVEEFTFSSPSTQSSSLSSPLPTLPSLQSPLIENTDSNNNNNNNNIIHKKNNNHVQRTSTSSTTTTNSQNGTNVSNDKTVYDLRHPIKNTKITKIVGLDCEMVGIADGKEALGSVCIVNSYGYVIYKSYSKPNEPIVDYRKKYSGLTWHKIHDAPNIDNVQKEVIELIKDKIVVGHNLEKDFKVIGFQYQMSMVRDSFYYPPLFRPPTSSHPAQAQSLKKLAIQELSVDIQTKYGHSSIEDAIASMLIYNKHKKEWEEFIKLQIKLNLQNGVKDPTINSIVDSDIVQVHDVNELNGITLTKSTEIKQENK